MIFFQNGIKVYAGEIINEIVVFINNEAIYPGMPIIKGKLFDCKNTNLTIGNYPNSRRDWALNGLIDNIRIYNRELFF